MRDPLAYFITFRTFGTWLPGDERGWVRRGDNAFGAAIPASRVGLERYSRTRLASGPLTLDEDSRGVVRDTCLEVCRVRQWHVHAIDVRTNHVHVVVSAGCAPERVMGDLKAWSTRRLREANLARPDASVWSRHGSTVYLWKPEDLAEVCCYVVEYQGD